MRIENNPFGLTTLTQLKKNYENVRENSLPLENEVKFD
jgi:hypothetical protein